MNTRVALPQLLSSIMQNQRTREHTHYRQKTGANSFLRNVFGGQVIPFSVTDSFNLMLFQEWQGKDRLGLDCIRPPARVRLRYVQEWRKGVQLPAFLYRVSILTFSHNFYYGKGI